LTTLTVELLVILAALVTVTAIARFGSANSWARFTGSATEDPRPNWLMVALAGAVIAVGCALWITPPTEATTTCRVQITWRAAASEQLAAAPKPNRGCPMPLRRAGSSPQTAVVTATTTKAADRPDTVAGTIVGFGVLLVALGALSGRIEIIGLPGGTRIVLREASRAVPRAVSDELSSLPQTFTAPVAALVVDYAQKVVPEIQHESAQANPTRLAKSAAHEGVAKTALLLEQIDTEAPELDPDARMRAIRAGIDELVRRRLAQPAPAIDEEEIAAAARAALRQFGGDD
jgi:hypothetical protein